MCEARGQANTKTTLMQNAHQVRAKRLIVFVDLRQSKSWARPTKREPAVHHRREKEKKRSYSTKITYKVRKNSHCVKEVLKAPLGFESPTKDYWYKNKTLARAVVPSYTVGPAWFGCSPHAFLKARGRAQEQEPSRGSEFWP